MDPSVFDPQTFDLGIILTAAGVPIAGAIIAALIQVLKRVPVIGPVLATANGARTFNVLLCAALVIYAAVAIEVPLTAVSGFLLLLAWVNLVGFTDKAYDVAPESVKTALGGAES